MLLRRAEAKRDLGFFFGEPDLLLILNQISCSTINRTFSSHDCPLLRARSSFRCCRYVWVEDRRGWCPLYLFVHQPRMGTTGATKIPMGNSDIADDSETTVEIKIKTLDSQTYTIRVNKCVPVPALKEQIAIVTGVLSEQQRLICRGRVLKDDELLSAYHVEDGHTLHLVVRQPHHSSSTFVGSEGQSANSSLDNIPNHSNQVSRTVVLEAVNIDQADMNPTFLNRIMANILNSFGPANNGSGNAITNNRDGHSERLPRSFGDTGVSGSQNQPNSTSQISQNMLNISSQRIDSERQHADFQFPSAVSSGPQNLPAIPHSLTTLHQYLAHLKNALRREISGSNDRDNNSSEEASTAHHNEGGDYYISQSHHSSRRDDLPSPAALAEILQLTQHLLAEHVEIRLLGLARELENDTNITDYLMRLNVQSSAIRTGYFLQNFGSLLLELGRTTMTLRMGQVPSEAVVNSGPAVFISASGPNPVMVQPVPFYPAPSFGGMNTGPTFSDHVPEGERVGSSSFPRNIDIRIHAVPIPASMQTGLGGSRQQQENLNSTRTSAGADSINQPVQGQARGPTLTGEYGLRVVPVRTVVAMPAAISNSQANLPGNLVPLLHPLLSRVQQQNGGSVNEVLTPQAFSVHQGSIEANQEPIPDSVRQILESYVRGSVQEETQAGSYSMPTDSGPNILLTAQNELQGTVYVTSQHLFNGYNERSSHVNDDNDPGQAPLPQNPNILNHSSTTVLVGDQANTVGVELQGSTLGSQTEEASAEGDADFSNASISINDQGVLFSNFLRQLMPLLAHDSAISQDASSVPSNSITLERVDLNDPSSSQHPRDFSELPSSKRHKRE